MENPKDKEIFSKSHSFEQLDTGPSSVTGKAPSLIQRIFSAFLSKEASGQEKHPKKICAHKENAAIIRLELEKAKEELKAELDQELLPMITEVIDPMLRDVERINRITKREEGDDSTSLQFQEWAENAKPWVELYSKKWDKEGIKAEIVRHIIDKSIQKIEKDIRFIESYFEQFLEQLALTPQETERIRQKREKSLLLCLDKMRKLKTPPEQGLNFEEVSSWRLKLDVERSKLHNAALQLIEGK